MTPCLGPRLREPVPALAHCSGGGRNLDPRREAGANKKVGIFCMEAEKGIVHSSYLSGHQDFHLLL